MKYIYKIKCSLEYDSGTNLAKFTGEIYTNRYLSDTIAYTTIAKDDREAWLRMLITTLNGIPLGSTVQLILNNTYIVSRIAIGFSWVIPTSLHAGLWYHLKELIEDHGLLITVQLIRDN